MLFLRLPFSRTFVPSGHPFALILAATTLFQSAIPSRVLQTQRVWVLKQSVGHLRILNLKLDGKRVKRNFATYSLYEMYKEYVWIIINININIYLKWNLFIIIDSLDSYDSIIDSLLVFLVKLSYGFVLRTQQTKPLISNFPEYLETIDNRTHSELYYLSGEGTDLPFSEQYWDIFYVCKLLLKRCWRMPAIIVEVMGRKWPWPVSFLLLEAI